MNNKSKNIIFNYILFIVGLFIASIGVAFSAKSGLGTSPVASVPYSVSLIIPAMSFGSWLNLWSVIQISIQVALLRKKCKPLEILIQTILAFAYGYLTDFSCFLIRGISVYGYFSQILLMLAGCVILALGIWIQFRGGVAMLPGEAMNRAIAEVTGKKYENIKILFDVLYIAVASIICLAFLGKLSGVREGSIIAALLVGSIIKFYNQLFSSINKKDR